MILDDGAEEASIREQRGRLTAEAQERGVRVERLSSEAGNGVARYAELLCDRHLRRRLPRRRPRPLTRAPAAGRACRGSLRSPPGELRNVSGFDPGPVGHSVPSPPGLVARAGEEL